MLSSISVSRYPMICAGINIDCITSKANSTLGFLVYAVTSTSAIHRSKSTAIKPSYVQFLNTAKLFGIHTLPKQFNGLKQSNEEQHVTLSADTDARPVSLPCCLSLTGSLLAERRRHARLVMFYKIHFQLEHDDLIRACCHNYGQGWLVPMY